MKLLVHEFKCVRSRNKYAMKRIKKTEMPRNTNIPLIRLAGMAMTTSMTRKVLITEAMMESDRRFNEPNSSKPVS